MFLEGHEVSEIPNFKNYYATTCGNIISTKRKEARMLKIFHDKDGYRITKLSKEGKRYNIRVGLTILRAFEPKPDNMFQATVDHINNIRDDDRIENLRWLSLKDNQMRRFNGS